MKEYSWKGVPSISKKDTNARNQAMHEKIKWKRQGWLKTDIKRN